jgi:NADH-quinone oxidoreductase subunit L
MKAFIMTAAGDVCLLIAVFIILNYAKTINFMELYHTAPAWLGQMSITPGLLALVAVMLLGGAIGKSAQFPLHEWLPEAMAGPAPVSALIHAATMVKAGIYLVARMLPIFYYGYWVGHFAEAITFFTVVAWVGIFTAFLAATQAMTALELKKVLAYSTISQIGYMMLGLGVAGLTAEGLIAGYTAGLFHLMSHAIFKAILFLCAGSVLHACKTLYMDEMGGIRREMPLTYTFMLIGALALSGIPPLVGFWSKDSIFIACLETGQHALLALAAITAAMTFFYSIRFMSMTFCGRKSRHLKRLEREGIHVHEADKVMWVPYAILAVLVIALGLIAPFIEGILHDKFHMFLHTALPEVASNSMPTSTPSIAMVISVTALALGGIPSYIIYVKRKIDPKKLIEKRRTLRALHSFILNRWYMNPVYYKVFVHGTIKLARSFYRIVETFVSERISYILGRLVLNLSWISWKFPELKVIDRISPTLANSAMSVYHKIKRIQTGILSYNMIYVVLVLLFLLILMLGMGL